MVASYFRKLSLTGSEVMGNAGDPPGGRPSERQHYTHGGPATEPPIKTEDDPLGPPLTGPLGEPLSDSFDHLNGFSRLAEYGEANGDNYAHMALDDEAASAATSGFGYSSQQDADDALFEYTVGLGPTGAPPMFAAGAPTGLDAGTASLGLGHHSSAYPPQPERKLRQYSATRSRPGRASFGQPSPGSGKQSPGSNGVSPGQPGSDSHGSTPRYGVPPGGPLRGRPNSDAHLGRVPDDASYFGGGTAATNGAETDQQRRSVASAPPSLGGPGPAYNGPLGEDLQLDQLIEELEELPPPPVGAAAQPGPSVPGGLLYSPGVGPVVARAAAEPVLTQAEHTVVPRTTDKERDRRTRNKEAVRRSRARTMQRVTELEQQLDNMVKENLGLKQRVRELERLLRDTELNKIQPGPSYSFAPPQPPQDPWSLRQVFDKYSFSLNNQH